MAKAKIFNDKKTVETIIDGIIENADIVAQTYGYNGKDMLVNRDGNTIITNDGVFVSNHIFFDDQLKDLGSSLIRNITFNSDLSSGDGTTSSAIITRGIVKRLKKVLKKKNINTLNLKNGILAAQERVNEEFKTYCKKAQSKDYYNIAFTATRNEEISNLITDIFKKIGSKGKVLFKETDAQGLSVEYQSGFTFDFGYNTNMLPNLLDDCSIVLFKERINSVPVLQEIVKATLSQQKKNLLLIVKDGVADIVMQTALAIQQSKDIDLNINIVKITGAEKIIDRLLKDLSVITSAKIIDNSSIQENNYLGYSKKVTITEKQTTLVDSKVNKKEYDKHISNLEKTMIENRSENDKEDIRKRIGNLQGMVAIINIGALSREKVGNYKDKIKDVVNSLRNAIDTGVVPGGGSTLFNISCKIEEKGNILNKSKDFNIGFNIVIEAIQEPIKQILINSQLSPKQQKSTLKFIKERTLKPSNNCTFSYDFVNDETSVLDNGVVGYNAKSNKVENLAFNGVLDPYTTIINSFNNAIEIASMITTLNCAIITKTEVFKNESN